MIKYALSLVFFMSFNLPAFAGHMFEGLDAEDSALEHVAKGIVQTRGEAPLGWELDPQKTIWTYSVIDNIDGNGDCIYCIKNGKMFTGRYMLLAEPRDIDLSIQAKIESNLFKEENSKISVKRNADNDIECTIKSEDSVDLGGALIHYYYSKQVTLKKKLS